MRACCVCVRVGFGVLERSARKEIGLALSSGLRLTPDLNFGFVGLVSGRVWGRCINNRIIVVPLQVFGGGAETFIS
jgi:hypothetical protein